MEDKLRHLKKHMDKTVLKDIDFGESEKENVRKAIHTQARRSSRPWIYQMKNGLGVAVCLLLLFGGLVYALGQQGAIDKLGQTGSPSNTGLQPKGNGNVSTFSAPVQKKNYPPLKNVVPPHNQNKVLLVRMMGDFGWKLTRNDLYRTTDGGDHWNHLKPSGGNYHFGKGAFFLNSKVAWVTAYFENGDSVIYQTEDGGDTWSVPANSFHGSGMFDFINQTDGWILQTGKTGDHEKIFRTKNGGDTWSTVAESGKSLPADGQITGIGFNRNNPEIGWATGYYPDKVGHIFLYKTTNSGTKWNPVELPSLSFMQDTLNTTHPPMFLDGGWLLPVTTLNLDTKQRRVVFYHWGNNGWQATGSQPVNGQVAYDFINSKLGWMVDSENVYVTKNNAVGWTEIVPGDTFKTVMKNGTPKELDLETDTAARLIVQEHDGSTILLKTEDGGQHWTKVNPSHP